MISTALGSREGDLACSIIAASDEPTVVRCRKYNHHSLCAWFVETYVRQGKNMRFDGLEQVEDLLWLFRKLLT